MLGKRQRMGYLMSVTGCCKPRVFRKGGGQAAMTLVELVVAMGVAFVVLGTLTYGYIQAYRMTDASTLQAAAHRLVVDRMDTVRRATWRHHGTSSEVNELPMFAGTILAELELPLLTTNRVWAALTTEVADLEAATGLPLFRITVAGVCTNLNGRVFTNVLTSLRAPE